MDVKDEVNEMLDVLEGKVSEDEPIDELEPNNESKGEEGIKEGEIKSTDESDSKAKLEPKTDTEPEPEPEPEPDKDKIIEDLRNQLNSIHDKKVETPITPTPEESIKLESHDFIGDLDPEDIIRDKELFNNLLNNVYTKGVSDAKKMATESVLLTIPDIVKSTTEILNTLKEASDNFYKENEDLKPFKKVVAAVFEDIHSQNPDKSYEDIMKIVGDESRRRLNLQRQAIKNTNAPRLPNKTNGRISKSEPPPLNRMEAEIEAMNKILL